MGFRGDFPPLPFILGGMHDQLHTANIAIHVLCGASAFGVGLITLARPKGDKAHRRRGRVFVALMAGVIATASLGAVMFRSDPTLVAITFLVAYLSVSGWRATRPEPPDGFDKAFAVSALVGGSAFLAFLATGATAFWRPEVTRPIGGALIVYASYDLIRLVFPRWRARIRPLEHGVKMILAVGALASAGTGTLAPQWQPWSQLAPSVVFSTLAITFVIAHALRKQPNSSRVRSS